MLNRTKSSTEKHPIRILHVVGGMNRGGIETWLMHVLRHIDRDRFHLDFLVHTTKACAYDDEIRVLGSKIIPCLHPSRPWSYAHNFKQILRDHGPYDVIHSHVHHFSGYILYLAKQANVPVCIAHSHNDTSSAESSAGLFRRLYLTLMRRWITDYSTIGLGCSHEAATDLFGPSWEAYSRWQTLHCGIDLTPFQEFVDPVTVRSDLGIPAEAFVIGHVGRFEEQKNHQFLIEITAEVAKQEPRVSLLLVGDGSLRPDIEQKVSQEGLAAHVILAGTRSDVPQLMLGAMDVFLLPSLYEGLGLVLVEAQAAGLPCVFSDIVPEEADVFKPLVRRMSLSQSTSAWAEAVLAALDNVSTPTRMDALTIVEKSAFNIETGVKELLKVYESHSSKY